jgi:hypothetical protein
MEKRYIFGQNIALWLWLSVIAVVLEIMCFGSTIHLSFV